MSFGLETRSATGLIQQEAASSTAIILGEITVSGETPELAGGSHAWVTYTIPQVILAPNVMWAIAEPIYTTGDATDRYAGEVEVLSRTQFRYMISLASGVDTVITWGLRAP